MLEKVIVRIIYYTSNIVTGIGWLAIIGSILLSFLCIISKENHPLTFLFYCSLFLKENFVYFLTKKFKYYIVY